MAREIMRSRVLVNDLTAFSFIQVRDSRPNMVCLTSNPDYNHGAINKDLWGINKVLLLLNEHGDPSFLFQNLSSCNILNQQAKFDKNLSASSISVE